jgi:hypothetical protein
MLYVEAVVQERGGTGDRSLAEVEDARGLVGGDETNGRQDPAETRLDHVICSYRCAEGQPLRRIHGSVRPLEYCVNHCLYTRFVSSQDLHAQHAAHRKRRALAR